VASEVEVEEDVLAKWIDGDEKPTTTQFHKNSLNKQGYAARVITEDRNHFPDKVALASACGIVNIATVRVGAFLLHKQISTA
jgi:hypothetical protein